MALTDALKATRIIETLENYSVAADTAAAAPDAAPGVYADSVFDDAYFWHTVLNSPDNYWNKTFEIRQCTLCNWTPRIPGLYWAPGSAAFRQMAESQKVLEGPGWVKYTPGGKTGKVMGGMGGLLLPPDNAGYTLCSITASGNSSVGIPVLIAPEVAEHHNLKQGDSLNIREARWVKMSMDWQQRFPSIKGIPRGYMLVNKPENVTIAGRDMPVQFQPCTIMEYWQDGVQLYDYVFMTADSTVPDYRKQAEGFFEEYRTEEGRNGRYLLACDMANPLFDAVYQSPAELRTGYDNGQMALMLERIRNSHFNNHNIDELARLIPKLYVTGDTIITLARLIELPDGLIKQDSALRMTVELLHQCLQHQKMEELIDRIAVDHPGAFNTP